jgi:hypothetical protein
VRHERTINEYRSVKYEPDILDAFTRVLIDTGRLVYVEGCVKLKPCNMRFRHSWVFDPTNGTGLELGFRGGMLNDLKIGEFVPWSRVEYHGYEITKEEMKKTERPSRVVSESDLDLIWKKLTSLD